MRGKALPLRERCLLVVATGLARKTMVYGSHARGTARADSDLDLRFVIDTPDEFDAATEFMIEHQGWDFDLGLEMRGEFFTNDHPHEAWAPYPDPGGPRVPFLVFAAAHLTPE